MPTKRFVLVAPGLLQHGASARQRSDGQFGPAASFPNLKRLLACATMRLESEGIEAVLAQTYGIVRQRDWPLASVFATAEGLDLGSDCWFIADPVTLVAGHHDVHTAGAVADLAADESDALLESLNAHFASDGVVFVAPRPGCWFVRVAAQPALVTHPLSAVVGSSLRDRLPSGEDAGKWRRWQDEMQMLLFAHPVNAGREARAKPPANGIWLWGGGVRAAVTPRPLATYADDHTAAAALAAYTGTPSERLPDALGDLVVRSRYETIVVALDRNTDAAALDHRWLGPLWRALGRGSVHEVVLIGDDGGDAAIWTIPRPSVWRRVALRFRAPDLPAFAASSAHP